MSFGIRTWLALCAATALSAASAYSTEVSLPSSITISAMQGSSPTVQWAVERVSYELQRVHQLRVTTDSNAVEPFRAGLPAQVTLGVQGKWPAVDAWCGRDGVEHLRKRSGPNAYRVTVLANPLRVAIIGSDEIGAWYGACAWLDSLKSDSSGLVRSPVGEMSGSPKMNVRFIKPFPVAATLNASKDWVESQTPMLDWCARWRGNAHHVGALGENTSRFLAEAHKRGIRLILSLPARSVCPSDEKQVADFAAQCDEFFRAGGDGVSMTWDDLFGERIQGHCEKCRERFGKNGIKREIVFMLETVYDVAAKYPGGKIIIWCPPHYVRNRYAELPDDEFYGFMSASKKVRTGTYLWYTQCANEPVSFLDRQGMKRRIWWYNGMYPLSDPVVRRKPQSIKDKVWGQLCNLDFVPFDAVGFIEDILATNDVWTMYPAGDEKWKALHAVGDRFQGMYFCGKGYYDTPYHAGVTELFSFSPRTYDQKEADRVVFRALFGPGSEWTARAWSDLGNKIEERLAKKIVAGEKLSEAEAQETSKEIQRWQRLRTELETLSARGLSLAPPSFTAPIFSGMAKGEGNVRQVLQELSGNGN